MQCREWQFTQARVGAKRTGSARIRRAHGRVTRFDQTTARNRPHPSKTRHSMWRRRDILESAPHDTETKQTTLQAQLVSAPDEIVPTDADGSTLGIHVVVHRVDEGISRRDG